MWRVTALLVVWLGLCASAPAIAASAADAMLTQANAALASGQYQAAQSLAASGLAEAGLDASMRSRLLVARGLSRQALGQSSEALVDFTDALRGDALAGEERARVLFARGLTLDGQGRLEVAVGDYTAALAFAPRAPYALNNRANVYRRQGRFADARRDYIAALEAGTPNPQYPYFGLGQIAESENDMEAARNFYNRALAADPAFTLARERLQAMGAPMEGPAGLPTDTGIIVLKPPSPRLAEAPVTLRPPPAADDAPAVPASAPTRTAQPIPVAETPRRPAPPTPPPGRGLPLRSTIVDGGNTYMGPLVQLGAWRSQAEAQLGWTAARTAAEGLLDALEPVIQQAQVAGRGTYYRLRVPAKGPVSQFCASLAAKGLDCIPARD